MDAEDMVLLDGEEKVLAGKYKPSVETPLHLGIYKKRPEINAIVHVHSLYATAFAVARQNIPVILEEAAQVIGHEVRVAPYALCVHGDWREMSSGSGHGQKGGFDGQ